MFDLLKTFRKFKLVTLSLALLVLVAGAADAFSPNPHEWKRYQAQAQARGADDRTQYAPHAETVAASGDKIYGLYTLRGGDYNDLSYKASVIVEFDEELNEVRSVDLEDASGNVGKNAEKMALYDGKLYVACIGGAQGPGTWGSVWEVDTDAAVMTARRVIDASTLAAFSDEPDALVYSIAVADDGTAYLLVIVYDEFYSVSAKLFVTDVTRLSNGDVGTAFDITGTGYSWGLAYEEEAATLWCMTGSELQARDKSGALVKTITTQDLGNNVGTITPLADTGAGKPGVFYTATAADYTTSSTGVVTKDGDAFAVSAQNTNFGSDIRGFAHTDPDGAGRVLVRDTTYSTTDRLYIWDVTDWTSPILNEESSFVNAHGATARGQYLYIAAYDGIGADGAVEYKGEFVRLDMKDSYKRDKTYGLDYVVDGLAKGEVAMASPDLPTGAPANVEAIMPSLAASADFIASTDFTVDDVDVDDDDGAVTLKADPAKTFAETVLAGSDWDGNTVAEVIALPAFTASVANAGNVAAVGFTVTGETLMMSEPPFVKIMKARGNSLAPLAFSYVSDAADYADGKFTILEGTSSATAIFSGNEYTLVLFIQDGGDYDLDETDGAILDPAVIVKTSTSGGGGSSGCNTGSGVLALVAAVALLRSARRCYRKK